MKDSIIVELRDIGFETNSFRFRNNVYSHLVPGQCTYTFKMVMEPIKRITQSS